MAPKTAPRAPRTPMTAAPRKPVVKKLKAEKKPKPKVDKKALKLAKKVASALAKYLKRVGRKGTRGNIRVHMGKDARDTVREIIEAEKEGWVDA